MKYNRVCAYCGKTFISMHRDCIYCSKKCGDISIRIKKGIKCNTNTEPFHKVCKVCGKPYDSYRESSVACSSDCSREYRRRSLGRSKRKDGTYHYKRKTGVRPWDKYVADVKAAAEQRKQVREIEQKWYRASHTVERECEVCGKHFYCLDAETIKTCSHACSRKLANSKKDKRIPKKQRVEKVSLHRLFKRDNGVCYLCGGACDWNDWAISKKGNKYPGDMYPTKEHVVPVSKGGKDSWDNVRLAHSKCNREKADGIIEIEPISREFAISQKFKSNAKQTAQYTLDGSLIKIWDSTGQIERELGLNSRHIQNVCRRTKSKTGNAYGYHWEYVS